jgi:predicted Zn-dependent peptidase
MVSLTLNSSSEQAAQFSETPDYEFLSQYLPAVYADDARYKFYSSQAISEITLEQLQAVQSSILDANQGMVIAIVGDVTPDQVAPFLRLHVAGLPLAEPSASVGVGPVVPANNIVRVEGQADEKSDIRYVFSQVDLPINAERFLVSEVMIQALDKRLHNAIREDSGLTYGTSVFQSPQYYFEQQWLLHVRMSTDPVREQEALDVLDATLANVLVEPFTVEEVEQAALRVKEEYKQMLSTNEGMLNQLTDILLLGLSFTEFDNFEQTLELVDAVAVNDFVSSLLNGKKVVAIHYP